MSNEERALSAVASRLCAAQRPVILVGPEGAPAARAIVEMAERLGAPILTTPDAKSAIDHRHSHGTFSFGASASARALVEQADLILAISALGEFSCGLGEAFRTQCLIQITERASDVGRSVQPHLSLVGPALTDTVFSLQRAVALLLPAPARLWCERLKVARPSPAVRDFRLRRLVDYLQSHLDKRPPLAELAAVTELSKWRLCVIFEQTYGISIGSYWRELRSRDAGRRLRRGVPIKLIVSELGYADEPHFSREFKAHYGLTPGRWLSLCRDSGSRRARSR